MADEPRRSGRSTKGQHKNLDMITETPAKKTKAKAQPKEKPPKPSIEPTPAPSEEEEIIRCICGEYEEEEDVERDMICCDRCSAWQHNDCMGLTYAKGEEPDEYFCEQCKPENHQVLLQKIALGEKPWEDAAEKRRKEAEEKKASRRRKSKKGGRRGRPSEPKSREPKVSEPKISEPKASEPRASEPRVSETKASEHKASEPKTSEPKASEPEASEPKASEPRASEPRASTPKASAHKVSEAKASELKANEPKANEPQAIEPKASEPETIEPETSEPKASERKTSESKTETITPARAATSSTPAPASTVSSVVPIAPSPATTATPVPEKNGHVPEPQSTSAQKRKFDEHQEVQAPEPGPKSKQQKMSPPVATPTVKPTQVKNEPSAQPPRKGSGGGTAVADLTHATRKSVAKALINLFGGLSSDAQKEGSFKLPEGSQWKSAEEYARQLALSIESAMYQNICGGTGDPSEAYRTHMRTILFNVKKNPSLRDRLLVGSLLPDTLSKMSSEDMASEELQQKNAEIKREAERQHIIVQDQGPRIRRTHKGEELVEDDNHLVASEPVFSTAATRRNLADADGQSPTSAGPDTDGPRKPSTAQDVDTKMTDSVTTHHDHFPARAHSPGGTSHEQVFPEVSAHIREQLPTARAQADAEIDQLLRDDEPDSPPYSPKEFHDEGSIWHGTVVMNPIAEFSSFARHVGGADLSGRIPWSQLAPSTLLIDGRIDIQLASNYLCGLRFSSSTDVTVISISRPDSPKERAGFDKLFSYFQDRKRYGVVGMHPLPAVKDTYLIPIEAGSTKKPDFIELLENNALEDPTPERVLLVVFAVKTGDSNPPSVQPPSHIPSQEPGSSASPLTVVAATPQQPHFMTPGPPHASQFTPTPASSYDGASQTHNPYGEQAQPQQPPPPAPQFAQYQPPAQLNQTPLTGLAAAVQVLGPQSNSPAIQQLLHQAPNADVSQLSVIRDILLRRPEAGSDYKMLMDELLIATTTNGHGPQQNAR
ncbi:hypothetical protein BO94DRAFT_566888 [Aspergillus sclerotioniger CBS 115572]|uniref:Transcription factor BYE1 n=1 Tax=Aspergillus sclerotioniger CBS 115572 TaxID=1450535 RepID=A0A317WC06_9EURO|nr:hypothetical protein BO94DRAFT_566888 [Aspergillus sclerotioniger CBS 115572]PWY83739.1 hypothetical protein BO94DRAFT_566888 [Aspergillus sclerotioniger CBS 115572]